MHANIAYTKRLLIHSGRERPKTVSDNNLSMRSVDNSAPRWPWLGMFRQLSYGALRSWLSLLLLAVGFAVMVPDMAQAHGGTAKADHVVADMHVDGQGSLQTTPLDCCHIDGSCSAFAVVPAPRSPRAGLATVILVKPASAQLHRSRYDAADPPPPRV